MTGAAPVLPAEAPRPARGASTTPGVSRAAHARAIAAIALLTVALFGIALRAWGLQVGSGDHFREKAARQHAITVEIPAPRGAIVDRLGRPLAVTADADSVWADPREVRDVAATAEQLARLLGVDVRSLEEKLASERRFVWLARRINPTVIASVRAANLAGIEISPEPHRYYPAGGLAGTLLGRSNIDGHGIDGIELMMDQKLRGERSRIAGLRDARGRMLFLLGEPRERQKIDCGDTFHPLEIWSYGTVEAPRHAVLYRPRADGYFLLWRPTESKRALYMPEMEYYLCLLYTSPSPRDGLLSRMPSSA